MRFGAPQKASYNPDTDSFPVAYLLVPCAVLGVLVNQDHYSLFEMVWAFSIYLEAVAILPQLFLLQKQGEVENLTSHYVFALGAYRGLYLLNWIFRYFTEEVRDAAPPASANAPRRRRPAAPSYPPHPFDPRPQDYMQRIVWIAGLVQTGLYCDFFYHYYESKKGGLNRPVKLPV